MCVKTSQSPKSHCLTCIEGPHGPSCNWELLKIGRACLGAQLAHQRRYKADALHVSMSKSCANVHASGARKSGATSTKGTSCQQIRHTALIIAGRVGCIEKELYTKPRWWFPSHTAASKTWCKAARFIASKVPSRFLLMKLHNSLAWAMEGTHWMQQHC